MLTMHTAQTPRPLRALSPLQAATPQDSEDGFEIIDEGYASDTFSHSSRSASQPLREATTIARAVMGQPRAQGHIYPLPVARMPAYRPDVSPVVARAAEPVALTPQQAQRAARRKELASYERILLPTARLGAWHSPSQLRCPLTHQLLTAIARPVLVRRHQHFSIYDETAFLQWWLDNGTEPVSGRRIALMALYRPQIQPRV